MPSNTKKKLEGVPRTGRPPGVGYKSLLLREFLASRGIDLVEQILARIPKVSVEKQLDALTTLMPYVYPKLGHVTISKTPEEQEIESLSSDELIARAKLILLKPQNLEGTPNEHTRREEPASAGPEYSIIEAID